MSAWMSVGGRWVVALVLLGPAVVLACTRIAPSAWTERTPDGRFELSVQWEAGRTCQGSLSLHDRRDDTLLWRNPLSQCVYQDEVFLTPDGRHVAVVSGFSDKGVVYGPEGKVSGTWALAPLLTPFERQRHSPDPCGIDWVAEPRLEGDVLTLRVPIDIIEDGVHVRIELATGRVSRTTPTSPRRNDALIQDFQRTSDSRERRLLLRELRLRSEERARGVSPELSRFWLGMLREPSADFSLAVRALGAIGTDEEVRALADVPVPEKPESSSGAVFSVLGRRLPRDAERHALSVLQERRPPTHLRERAVSFLGEHSEEAFDRVLLFALRDPSPRVRVATLRQLEKRDRRSVSPRGFELALPLFEDGDASVREVAARVLCVVLWKLEGADFQAARDAARRAGAEVKLAQCSQ